MEEFFKSLNENVSEECFSSIISLVEEEVKKVVDLDKVRKKNELAKQVNDMFASGDTDLVRQTTTGEIVGNPEVVKRLMSLKKKVKELNDLQEGSYKDEQGNVQYTLPGIDNGLNGRNLQQENAEASAAAKAEREAKKNKPKNPNRVAGGKKAQVTRKNNAKKAFYERPILKALGVKKPEDNNA